MEFLFIRPSGHVGHRHEPTVSVCLGRRLTEVNPHVLELSSIGNELERVPLSVCFFEWNSFL